MLVDRKKPVYLVILSLLSITSFHLFSMEKKFSGLKRKNSEEEDFQKAKENRPNLIDAVTANEKFLIITTTNENNDKESIILPKEIAYLSGTIKAMHNLQIELQPEDADEIHFSQITKKTLESIRDCLSSIHEQIKKQKSGQIVDRNYYIVGDNVLVKDTHFVAKEVVKFIKPIIQDLSSINSELVLEAQKNIILAANFLDIPWLVNAVVSLWLDRYIFFKKININNLDEPVVVQAIFEDENVKDQFPEEIIGYVKEQLRLKKAPTKEEFTIADYVLIHGLNFSITKGTLDLNYKKLTSLADYEKIINWDAETKDINKITMKENFIAAIPSDFLNNFTLLKNLDFFNNKLKVMPAFNNFHLESLGLAYNRLEKFPSLDRFTHLKVLDISNNQIEELSPLPHSLQYLNIALNKVKNLPSFDDFTELTELNANGNEIETVPSLANCMKLKRINFCYNKIIKFPSVGNFHQLEYCNFNNQNI